MIAAAVALLVAAAPSSAPAPEALLLGMKEGDALVTYLVDAAGAQRLGRGLAVPRATGWWIIDVSPGDDQKLWVAPATEGRPPWWAPGWRPQKTDEAAEGAGGAGTTDDAAAPDTEGGDAREEERRCEERDTVDVLFAGPDYASISSYGYSDCGAHPSYGGSESVVRLDAAGKGSSRSSSVSIGAILGKGAQANAVAAGEKEQAQHECLGDPDPWRWSIARAKGRWVARGQLGAAAGACGPTSGSYPIDVPLPVQLTGVQGAVPDLPALEKRTDVRDVLVSPSGTVRVVLTNEALEVSSGGSVSSRGDSLGGSVVLAQWATGRKNVDRWRREVKAALRPR
jgi:hypothetical protein